MLNEGDEREAKYCGKYRVEKMVKLSKQVSCYCGEKGKALFNPVFLKIEWENPPSMDKNEFWFRYWITFEGKKGKYGQFAPIMNENVLLELLEEAIKKDYFNQNFLKTLGKTITEKINSN